MPTTDPTAAPFSWIFFLVMVSILAASSLIFYLTTRRWTVRRHWVALKDWADDNRFKVVKGENAQLPPVLANYAGQTPTVKLLLTDRKVTLLQAETMGIAQGNIPAQPLRWHLLVQEIPSDWPATALRPTHAPGGRSVADLFSMSSFSSMVTSERFVVYSANAKAAARLSKSSARALLPPDVGLLLVEREMILDFSARPFDAIEFGRMIAVAEQVAGHLR